jgi:hypothetical protein
MNFDQLELFVKVFDITAETVRADNNQAFRNASYGNHLEFAKYMVRKFDLTLKDISERDNEAFKWVCWHGYLKFAQWMVDEFNIPREVICGTNKPIFKSILFGGLGDDFDIIKWLINRYQITREDILKMDNHPDWLYRPKLQTMQYIASHFKITKSDIMSKNESSCGFKRLCMGKPDKLQWAVTYFNINRVDDLPDILEVIQDTCGEWRSDTFLLFINHFEITSEEIRLNGNKVILSLCERKRLDELKWIVNKFNITREEFCARDNEIFKNIGNYNESGNLLELVQWVVKKFELTKDDICSGNNHFLRMLEKDKIFALETFQWIVDTFEITIEDIRAKNNNILRGVCLYWDLEFVQWLFGKFELTQEDIKSKDYAALIPRSYRGRDLEIIQWLVDKFDLTYNKLGSFVVDKMIRKACKHVQFDTVKWLTVKYNLTERYNSTYGSEKKTILKYAQLNGDQEIIDWIKKEYKM